MKSLKGMPLQRKSISYLLSMLASSRWNWVREYILLNQHEESERNAAAILGCLVVGRVVLTNLCGFLNGFRAFFLAPLGLGGGVNFRKYGDWAVVTGASEGIGRCYALELAKRGLNVVLMSRSEEKLSKVAAEIKNKFNRETRVIPVDFSDDLSIYSRLSDELSDLNIGVLVNNVGFAYEHPDMIAEISAERLYKIVQINCQPVVQMTRLLLPKMVAKGGGVIINISSSASLFSMPQFSVYSATKIFVNYVSQGIRKEYGSKGIVVQNVTPFMVCSAMSGIRRPSFAVPTAENYVKAAIATVGIQKSTYGCFSHALQGYFLSRLPECVSDALIWKTTNSIKARTAAKKNKSK